MNIFIGYNKKGMLFSTSFRWCVRLSKFKQKTCIKETLLTFSKFTRSSRSTSNAFYVWTANSSIGTFSLSCISVLKQSSLPVALSSYASELKILKYKRGLAIHIVWKIWDIIHTFLRFVQLSCIFIPLFLVYPLSFISNYIRSIWYRCLLLGIEFSGPIIIKLGQWASTRKDLFSEELCTYLSKLQRKTRPHSWYYTQKSLESAFGNCWQDIFVEIENDGLPIGSGCCAQVYKAWVRKDIMSANVPDFSVTHEASQNSFMVEVLEMLGIGRFCGKFKKPGYNYEAGQLVPVAMKVLHPQMETRLRQDLFILKTLASSVSTIIPSLRWLSLRECVDEFSQIMESQVNFYTEACNLELFARNFKTSKAVKFPLPVWPLTRPYILVESFEEGRHIENYMQPQGGQNEKKLLANVGVNTILKMVFEDNFIHGDLHPGNMLVQDHQVSATSNDKFKWSLRKSKEIPFSLVILDCGIVSTLDERGRNCLRDVFAAVANIDGEKVAELFLEHSNHRCTNIASFKKKMKEIVIQAMSKNVTLQQVDVSVLMRSLFSTMIAHQVKLDSSFSSVILAIMVVEGLGRSLDPTIDVVEKAKPFLFNEFSDQL